MKTRIHPEIRDIWLVAKVVQMTIGFNLGLYLYIYGIFFYESIGGSHNPKALTLTAIIFMISNLVMLVTDIPTGALGDYLGRKRTTILSFIFRALFFFLLAWVPFVTSTTWAFALCAISYACFGIGYTLYSGSFVAWVVDSVKERNHIQGHGHILSRSYGDMAIAQIIGAMISLSLYLHGYVFYAFALGFTSSILCAVFCTVVMKETKHLDFQKGKFIWKEATQRLKTIMATGFKISVTMPAVTYLILMYAAFMFLTHVVAYLWPVAMKSNFGAGKMSPYWYLIVFLSLGLNYVGAKVMEWVSHAKAKANGVHRNVSIWSWFAVVSIIMSLPIVILAIKTRQGDITLPLFIFAISISRFGYGFLRPCYETLINNYIPKQNAKERATIMSCASMLDSLLVLLLMIPSSGKTGEATTIGWLVPSGLLLGLTLVIYLLMRRYQKKIGEILPA